MIRLAINEIMVIKRILELYRRSTKREDYKERIREIIGKLDEASRYGIRYEITDAKKREVDDICGKCADWVRRYSSMTDSSRIFDYEEMKKEALGLSQTLGEMKATLEAEVAVAEEDMRRLRYTLSLEAKDGEKVSITEAEKRGIADERYGRALEDYRTLLTMSNRIREQASVMRAANGNIQQSVSHGRIGMTQESYSVREYDRNDRQN